MKVNKPVIGILFFFLVSVLPVSASTVSILVVEAGLIDESNSGSYSSLWEDSLMRVFFDAGHIVTNGNIVRMPATPSKALPDELLPDFEDAVEGGADYFVLALIQYGYINGKLCPQEVSLRMFSAITRGMLFQNTLPAGNRANLNDELFRATEAAKMIIPFVKER